MMSSRRSWFPAILASTSLATALVLAAATAEETKPAAATNPHPDAAYRVVQLRLVPGQVEFSNPRDYRRVLVLGKVEGGGEIDLTFRPPPPPAPPPLAAAPRPPPPPP